MKLFSHFASVRDVAWIPGDVDSDVQLLSRSVSVRDGVWIREDVAVKLLSYSLSVRDVYEYKRMWQRSYTHVLCQ